MNYGSFSSAFASCLLLVQLEVIYVCEDQVAEKRKGGENHKIPSARAATPPGGQPDHSWGLRQHTLSLISRSSMREMACVHSLLMTDVTVKCDELVRLSVMHGLGCENKKGTHFKTYVLLYWPL